jgi:hypothetical protein
MKTILRSVGVSALCVSAACLAQEPAGTQLVLSPAEMDGVTAGDSASFSSSSSSSSYATADAQGLLAGAVASAQSSVLSGAVNFGKVGVVDWNASLYTAAAIAIGGGGTSLVGTVANGSNGVPGASGGFSFTRTVSEPNFLSISVAYGVGGGIHGIPIFGQ